MYKPLKGVALTLLKAPQDAPEPPPGSHESVQIFRASPKFLTYRMLKFWVHLAFFVLVEGALIVASFASRKPEASILVVGVAVIAGVQLFLQYFTIRLDFDLRHYIVTDRSLRVREGAMIVREMTITHANVQNLRVVQGPLERLFGISSLEVDTAGGGGAAKQAGHGIGTGHTVRIAGIENAAEIRDTILAHLRKRGGGAGLGDFDDERERHHAAHAAAPADSADLAAALRDVLEAARGLRTAAEARPTR
jgi:membrane protein YdbS with pleckstrin-like domain